MKKEEKGGKGGVSYFVAQNEFYIILNSLIF